MQRISEAGRIDGNGKLLLPMDRLEAYFRANPGARVIVRFDIVEQGSTASQQAYYFNYVLPTIRQALRERGEMQTEETIDRWLRGSCPACQEDGKTKGARQLSKEQFSDFLDWLGWFAAENLNVYIEDPKVL